MRNWHYALMLGITIGLFAQAAKATDLEEGAKLYAAKEYAKALPLLERAAQFSPMAWQPHYYLANTNLALGRAAAAKYEYELCKRAASSNAAVVAKCNEGIARADKHSTKSRSSTPSSGAESSEDKSTDAAPNLTDAQVALKRKREDIMKHAREAVAKVRADAKDKLEHEKANSNQFFQYPDGRVGTDVDDVREEEIQRETEEKCKHIMREAESKVKALGG